MECLPRRQAVRKEIIYWRKVISWARSQPKKTLCSLDVMTNSLGESIQGEDCPLCQYNCYTLRGDFWECTQCPLHMAEKAKCGSAGTTYKFVTWDFYRISWKTWANRAEKHMLPALYSCFEYCL